MKRALFCLIIVLSVFVIASPVMAKVRITNTARCLFGSLVMGEKEIENSTGVEIVMNDNCAGLNEGVKMVMEGKADIGTCARELTEKEKGAGLVSIPLSTDAVAVVVNKGNPVESLSTEDVLKIFAGKIKNWNEVGGLNKKILVLDSECGASKQSVMPQWLAQYNIAPDAVYLSSATITSDITDNLIVKLEKYSSGIALVSPMIYTDKTKFLKVDGKLPTRENALNKSYPLIKPMNLVVKGKPGGEVKKVVDYMTGSEGQKIVEKNLAMDWLKEGF